MFARFRLVWLVALSAVLLAPALAPRSLRAQTGTLTIQNSRSYIGDAGSLHTVGEVANNSNSVAGFVKVTATFVDGSGAVIGTDFAYTAIGVLLPGEISPFDIVTVSPPDGIAGTQLAVTATPVVQPQLRGLSVTTGDPYIDPAGALHIPGQVTNSSSTTAQSAHVFMALYDAAGTVLQVSDTFTNPDSVPAGGASTFEVIAVSPPDYASFKTFVQAMPAG